jgi:glucose-1-phosphate cytidylyltransferase
MKVLILAGGLGTRLSEETGLKPKPMVEIGGKPILWHILKIYSSYGFNEFIILLGYKGYLIKEYFANYFVHMSDITIDIQTNSIQYLNSKAEPWKISLIDTGVNTMTGGRIKRVQHIVNNETFMLTYGDGVSDINIAQLLDFHKSHGKKLTMTSVQPEGRFGALQINADNRVLNFHEKPKGDGSYVNGGFFVCEPGVFDYIQDGDSTVFEQKPLENLANDGELYSYMHKGFWKAMDNIRDKNQLDEMIKNGQAPWINW